MRTQFAALALLAGLAAPIGFAHGARAEEPTESVADMPAPDRAAIQSVITGQIDAFRRDDGAAAYGYASPHIQAMFGDPAHFMSMVRTGYQPVYRPGAVAFDDLVTIDGRLVQKVELTGADGRMRLALYTMEHEPDGTWRIDGCALTRGDGVDA